MYLLDTDILIHLHAGNARVTSCLSELENPDLAIKIITRIELRRARFDFVMKATGGNELIRAQQFLSRTEELLSQLQVIYFDLEAVEIFDRFKSNSRLRKIVRADCLIASIAMARRATLVTRNIKHFQKFPGLKITNWAV